MYEIFVPYVRSLRSKEIALFEDKGYIVSNKADYTFTDKINIDINGKLHCFGIRVNINEVYFYILNKGVNLYLTISEIYELLWEIVINNGGIWVLEELEFYSKVNDTIPFEYRSTIFKVHKISNIVPNGIIPIKNSEINISYEDLFLLIYLIQDKSNYFESLSAEKKYENGLVRLLKVLLKCNSDNIHLATLGWKFNNVEKKYVLQKEKIVGERNKKRYYLTVDEERIII